LPELRPTGPDADDFFPSPVEIIIEPESAEDADVAVVMAIEPVEADPDETPDRIITLPPADVDESPATKDSEPPAPPEDDPGFTKTEPLAPAVDGPV
jgi:hypothetical protein